MDDGTRQLIHTRLWTLCPACFGGLQVLPDVFHAYFEDEPLTCPDCDAVEHDLWVWYLEWSVIARAAIQDRRMLRALGFRKNRLGGIDDEPEDAEPAAAPPSAALLPASTQTTAAVTGSAGA